MFCAHQKGNWLAHTGSPVNFVGPVEVTGDTVEWFYYQCVCTNVSNASLQTWSCADLLCICEIHATADACCRFVNRELVSTTSSNSVKTHPAPSVQHLHVWRKTTVSTACSLLLLSEINCFYCILAALTSGNTVISVRTRTTESMHSGKGQSVYLHQNRFRPRVHHQGKYKMSPINTTLLDIGTF